MQHASRSRLEHFPESKNLLIADDEPNIRRVLQAIFVKDGYEVQVAENGVKALEWASANPVIC